MRTLYIYLAGSHGVTSIDVYRWERKGMAMAHELEQVETTCEGRYVIYIYIYIYIYI